MICNSDNPKTTHVVLIHGLAAHRLLMWPLSVQLNRAGFKTSSFGYRSWLWSIEHHADNFTKRLNSIEQNDAIDEFHIVAHSMGGIVARTTLTQNTFSKLNRMVMLGSPNDGSPTATRLGTILPFAKTLNQVSDRPTSFVKELAVPQNVDIGVVAASYDFVIPEHSSHLQSEKDHIVIHSGHNGLLVRPTAAKNIVSFLKDGRFQR